tara:strand:- start:329 stop:1060 length:732 start_codon:yes stop_codon:yes gene_type:complete
LELVYSRDYREQRIKHLDSPEKIIELLNYLYVLLNVKKDNQLNEIEESVLNGVILNNFSNFSIDEIKHAFRLGVAGELGLEMYQKLDAITLGKVMTAYKNYKAKKIKKFKSMNKEQKKEITQAEKDEINDEFVKKCIVPYFDERKEMTEPKIDWSTYAVFKHLWDDGDIKLTKKEKEKFTKEAQKYWEESLRERKKSGENVSLDQVLSCNGLNMYKGCIALYHKADEILKNKEIDFKGWHDKL